MITHMVTGMIIAEVARPSTDAVAGALFGPVISAVLDGDEQADIPRSAGLRSTGSSVVPDRVTFWPLSL